MKYIIEIDDNDIQKIVTLGVTKCGAVYTRKYDIDDDLEELTADYINEHFGDLQDTAYQRGLYEGNDIGYKDGVNDGRNEAWEAARKIVEMTDPPYWGMFDEYKNDLFGKITASEAIEKLKAYEEHKVDENIKRGDVVRNKNNGLTYIVTLASDCGYVLLGSNGNCATSCITNTFEKTGKHFNIDKILEEMKK